MYQIHLVPFLYFISEVDAWNGRCLLQVTVATLMEDSVSSMELIVWHLFGGDDDGSNTICISKRIRHLMASLSISNDFYVNDRKLVKVVRVTTVELVGHKLGFQQEKLKWVRKLQYRQVPAKGRR